MLKPLLRAAVAGVALTMALPVMAADYNPAPNAEVDGLKAKFIDVRGQRTRYYDYGQGEAIVMIHGGGRGTTSSANNFSPIIPILAKNFRVLAIDKSAAGMTGNPVDDNDLSYEGEAKHTKAFIEAMKVGPAHVLGHSSGGAMAFFLAVTDPEVVKTLIVVSSGPGMPPSGEGLSKHDATEEAKCKDSQLTYEGRACRLKLLGHLPNTWNEPALIADAWMADQPKSVEARAKYASARAAALPDGPTTQSYRDRMWDRARKEGMKMPVMIITGKQDTISWDNDEPTAMLRPELGFMDIVGANTTRVKLVALNEAGHFPYRERPEQFAAEVKNFIEFWNAHPNTDK